MKLYIDIETIPTRDAQQIADIAATVTPPGNMTKAETIAAWEVEKKPALVEAAVLKTSFDGAYGQIACIGFATNDNQPNVAWHADWTSPECEPFIIEGFFKAVNDALAEETPSSKGGFATVTVVGHNVVNFDLRFIWQRCMLHGIRPPAWLPRAPRPWDPHIFDTMHYWTGDPRAFVSLDKLCSIFGIAVKGSEIGEEIDGSKVWDFVRAGKIELVAKYCAGDVARARALEQRMTFGED